MSERVEVIVRDGREWALLPREDYERLMERLEELQDIIDADEVVRRIRSGEDEVIPGVVAQRLIEGEHPVRVWREHRDLTVSALAERALITQAYLSQIETGKRKGTVNVLQRLARALSVDLEDLVEWQAGPTS